MRDSVRLLYLLTYCASGPSLRTSDRSPIKGVPRWRDRFVQYGIKMSFGGSGTLKIMIYVENYPQKRLADYHPLWGWEVLISGYNIYTYHICTYMGDKQRTLRYPTYTVRKSSLDHDSGKKDRG